MIEPAAQTTAPTPSAAPNRATSVAEARANAQTVHVEGGASRVQQRTAALAKVDKHSMARSMEAYRADKKAATSESGEPRAPTEPGVRDAKGRFAPKLGDAAATPTNPPAPSTTDLVGPGSVSAEPGKAAIPPEVQAHVSDLEKRYHEADEKLRNGAALAADRIADITDERDHYKALFEGLRGAVRKNFNGADVDELELRLAEQKLAIKRHERGSSKRQQEQTQAQVGQLATNIKAQCQAVIAKHPALDPKQNPAARAFWEARLMVPEGGVPPSLDDLERDAEAWAMIYRGRALVAAQQQQGGEATPRATPQPQSVIPHGQAGSQGASVPVNVGGRGAHVSNKAIVQHMNQFRALRGGKR